MAWLFYNLIFLSRFLGTDRTISPLTDNNIYYCRPENNRSSQKQPLLVSSTGEILSSGSTVYLAATEFANGHLKHLSQACQVTCTQWKYPYTSSLSSFSKHKHTSSKNISRPRNRAKKPFV